MDNKPSDFEKQITEASLTFFYNMASRKDRKTTFKPIFAEMQKSAEERGDWDALNNALAHIQFAMNIIGDVQAVIETINEENDGREHARMMGEAFASVALSKVPLASLQKAIPNNLKTDDLHQAMLLRNCPSLAALVGKAPSPGMMN